MIHYRDADYRVHVSHWSYTDPVEPRTPLRVRQALAAYVSFVLAHLGHYESATFLDAGCRLGWLSDYFRDSPIDYEGFDANPVAVARARALGRNVGPSATRDSYTVVFCRQVIQYVDDLPGFLRALEGKVAPGGLLAIVQSIPWTLEAPHHFCSCDSVPDILGLLSLPIEHVAPILDGAKGETVIIARRPA